MSADRKLSEDDLGMLGMAGQWGMLRGLQGAQVCMTGRMSMERSQLARLVEAAGGHFAASVHGGVRLLIVADDTVRWTTKMENAERAGILVLRETEFAARLLPTPEELLGGRIKTFWEAVPG